MSKKNDDPEIETCPNPDNSCGCNACQAVARRNQESADHCDHCDVDTSLFGCDEGCPCADCREWREAGKDREFDEKEALGYL